jgi:hypothetical protein
MPVERVQYHRRHLADQFLFAATFPAKILKGTKEDEMRIEPVTSLALAVNLKLPRPSVSDFRIRSITCR